MLPLPIEELKSHQDSKSMLHLWEKIPKGLIKIKIIGKLEIIAIILVDIKVQHIVFVI